MGMEFARDLWLAVRLIFSVAFDEWVNVVQWMTATPGLGQTAVPVSRRALTRLLVVFLAIQGGLFALWFVVGFFNFGVASFLASIAGLLWCLGVILLGTTTAPLGALLYVLAKGKIDLDNLGTLRDEGAKAMSRWMRLMLGVAFVGMGLCLFASVAPLHNNLVRVPQFLLAGIILMIAGVLNRKLTVGLAIAVAVTFLVSISWSAVSGDTFQPRNPGGRFVKSSILATGRVLDKGAHLLDGVPARVSPRVGHGNLVLVPIETVYQRVDVVRDYGVPRRADVSFHPETEEDAIVLRFRGKEHRKAGRGGEFEPPLPSELFPDPYEVRGNRPQTMTVKVW